MSQFPTELSRDALALNPLMAARVVTSGSSLTSIEIRLLARHQGLKRLSLTMASGTVCTATAELLQRPASLSRTPAVVVLLLSQAGVLVARSVAETSPIKAPLVVTAAVTDEASDLASALMHHVAPHEWPAVVDGIETAMPTVTSGAIEHFIDRGYVAVEGLIPRKVGMVLANYYRRLEILEVLSEGDRASDKRLGIYTDPAGRLIQIRLHEAVCALAGHRVVPTFTYAVIYTGGAQLPMHLDRPQCEYTISLLADYWPLPYDAPAPWPLRVQPAGSPTVELCPHPGGGVALRGRQLSHGRPPLPPEECCCIVTCHYVDPDFSGPLT